MDPQPNAQTTVILAQTKLAEIMGVDVDEIDLKADLLDELAIDSLQQLELVASLERELDVRLESEQWREARTLHELAQLLSSAEAASR